MPVSYSGTAITWPDSSTTTSGWTGFKNRIINGAMMIDQRNAGASVTPTDGAYTLDRWKMLMYNSASKYTVQQNAGSVTTPAGFPKYLGITSSSAYSVASTDIYGIQQRIEGFNTADLAWGTSSAATVTLSFWVRSSLTGTFGGAIQNNAGNRSYPFSYTISAANTWEQKSITIAGDTTGTWVGATNGIGMVLYLMIGVGSTFSGTAGAWAAGEYYAPTGATSVVGTNGATWYITGVQLERGSTASSFEYRPYGTELALCQRYYEKMQADGSAGNYASFGTGYSTGTSGPIHVRFSTKRATPTFTTSGTQRVLSGSATGTSVTTSDAYVSAAGNGYINILWTTSITTGNATMWTASNDSAAYVAASAEL